MNGKPDDNRGASRRRFLSVAASAGAVATAGSVFFGSRAYGRHRLTNELIESATPMLTTKNLLELRSLPAESREDIRDFFHGVCLNSHQFAKRVTSSSFRQKLYHAKSESERHQLMLLAFEGEVCGSNEVVNRLWTIAEEAAIEINRNWEICCNELAERWNVSVGHYGQAIDAAKLVDEMEASIQQSVAEALETSRLSDRRPVAQETVRSVAVSALLLCPLYLTTPWAGWPIFAAASLAHAFRYFQGLLEDPVPGIQEAISSRLAALGNRVGSELETEMRTRLTQLHKWQEDAIAQAAGERARLSLPIF